MGDALPHTDSRISTVEDDGVHDYDGSDDDNDGDDDNDEGIKMQLTQLYAFIVQVRGLLPEETCPGTLRRMCSALTAFLQSTDTNVSEKIWHLLEAQRACGELRQRDSPTLEEGLAKIIPAMDDLLQTLIQQIMEMLNSRFNEVREARQEEIQEATARHHALNTRLDEVLLSLGQAATHAKDREDVLNARLDEAATHAKDREDALNARLDEAATHAKDREDALNARLDEAATHAKDREDALNARLDEADQNRREDTKEAKDRDAELMKQIKQLRRAQKKANKKAAKRATADQKKIRARNRTQEKKRQKEKDLLAQERNIIKTNGLALVSGILTGGTALIAGIPIMITQYYIREKMKEDIHKLQAKGEPTADDAS